jgi:hypothetical protein
MVIAQPQCGSVVLASIKLTLKVEGFLVEMNLFSFEKNVRYCPKLPDV